ncbi:LPS export ABC transporter permease LptF [soil metagenome]
MRLKIIDRYIGKQILFSTVFGLLVLSVVLVLGNILQKMMGLLVRSEVPLEVILKFVGYILPFSLVFTVPWGFLTAILLVFGRLSADNELVSLRMAGQSIARICAPVFVLAAALTAACFWVNVSVAPHAESEMAKLAYKAALDNPLSLFVPEQVTDSVPGHRIYVGSKEGNVLTNFHMVQLSGKRAVVYVSAKSVVVVPSDDGNGIDLEMHDVEMVRTPEAGEGEKQNMDEKETPVAGFYTHPISLEKLAEKATRVRPSALSNAELRAYADEPETDEKERIGLLFEIQKRYSFSFACFTFLLVGIPLGITAQRRETSIGFVLSLMVAAAYFTLIIVAETFKKDPSAHPHLLVWLPNILFLTLGGILFWRLNRR